MIDLFLKGVVPTEGCRVIRSVLFFKDLEKVSRMKCQGRSRVKLNSDAAGMAALMDVNGGNKVETD